MWRAAAQDAKPPKLEVPALAPIEFQLKPRKFNGPPKYNLSRRCIGWFDKEEIKDACSDPPTKAPNRNGLAN